MKPEYVILAQPVDGKRYKLIGGLICYSERYNEFITVPEGYLSDGATGAFDIHSESWWIHDKICELPVWDSGRPITAWQASTVLADILRSEGRWLRAIYWQAATFLLGCHNARKNGFF